jgi:7-cyano-7-deazaguanine synthase
MRKRIAVVLASGGLDSCVAAAIAYQQYELAFLHLSYGQRTQSRELQAFNNIADHYRTTCRLIVPFSHLSAIGGSSLTDETIPVSHADLSSRQIPTSYVPFRNANMLSVAVSWGEVLGASAIFVGAVQEDSSGYPDCRQEFFAAFNEVIRCGTKRPTDISIVTPVIEMSKSEIVLRGVTLGAPLHLTWSCYQREDAACGVCDSCALRLRGFQLAGVEDPILYQERPLYTHA